MPASRFQREEWLNQAFRGQAASVPLALYLALFTTATDDEDGGTEVSGNGYARLPVAFTAPSADGTIANTAELLSTVAQPDGWGQVTHVGVYDALIGGNRRYHGQLKAPRWINGQMRFRMPAGALSVRLT